MYYSFFYIKCISDNNRHMLHTVSAAPLQPPPTSVSLMHNDVSGCCKYKNDIADIDITETENNTHTAAQSPGSRGCSNNTSGNGAVEWQSD